MKHNIKRILSYVKENKWLALITIVCMLGEVILEMQIPTAMGNLIDAVNPQGQLAYSGLSIEKKGRPCDRGADGAGGSRIPVLFTESRGFLSVCRRETTELHSAFGETASTVWHQQTDAGGRRARQK